MDVDPSQALVAEEEEDDAKSDGSLESLFTEKDDEKEEPLRAPLQPEKPSHANHGLAVPVSTAEATTQQSSAPRNAPPLLTRDTYPEFSPDLLMTTFMDGQVILWDCRVKSSANGVGRLSMHDKTPPWCMSVSTCVPDMSHQLSSHYLSSPAGLPMAHRSMQEDAMGR